MNEWMPYISVALLVGAGAGLAAESYRRLRAARVAMHGGMASTVTALDRNRQTRRRLHVNVGVVLMLHGLVIAASLFYVSGCLHERPLGLPGGEGDTIAQGRIATNLQRVQQAEQVRREQEQARQRITRESLLQMLREQDQQVMIDQRAQTATTLDDIGLPTGVGSGKTAAGSPHGTRIGGKLWLYRVRHNGDWNANSRALPALLREVRTALGVEVASRQEVISLDQLPEHRGAYMPTFLFITGTGALDLSESDRANLRDYLLAGGMLVADSSGGDFEQHTAALIQQVLPDHRLRAIEFDHEVFRGPNMPYRLPRGAPIYRQHGSNAARGVFDSNTGRLMVFLSPGDIGSGWASVEYGQSRSAVELAYQMGTNLVAYGLLHTRDSRDTEGAATP